MSEKREAVPLRVLFLCTANSARSQLGEALLAHAGGDLVTTASAGSRPGAGPHPLAIAVLRERGIAWEGKTSKGIDAVAGTPWDLVITVCDAARDECPVLPGFGAAHWGLPDPACGDIDGFRAVADELQRRIDQLLALPLVVMAPDALARAASALATPGGVGDA